MSGLNPSGLGNTQRFTNAEGESLSTDRADIYGQVSRNPGSDGYIYRTGGNSIYSESTEGQDDRLLVYDVMKDEWQALSSMKYGRADHAMCYYDGGLWVFGGNNGEFNDTVERYDIATDTWEEKPPLNIGRWKLSKKMPVIDGKVYVAGGQESGDQSGGRSNAVEEYDLVNETATVVSSMPYTHSFPMQSYYNGYLWCITGNTDDSVDTGLIQRYDPSTDTWEGPSNFTPHPGHVTDGAGVQVDDEFHMIGGWNPMGENAIPGEHWAYTFDTDEWTLVRKLPTGYSHGSAAYDGTYVWRFMGRCWTGDSPTSPRSETSSVWRYHREKEIEASVQRSPERAFNFGMLHTNDPAARPIGRE